MSPTHGRILIVEDHRVLATELQKSLVELGYEVAGLAASGEEAVRLAGELGPALALMDIHLQGEMDGIEAAGILRERFDIPTVYLSALVDEETIRRASGTAPFGYLVKPFNEHQLRAAIEIALYKHETERIVAEERAHRRAAQEAGLIIDSVEEHAIFRVDTAGRIASWNTGAERINGYTAAEARGEPFARLFRPAEADADDQRDPLLERAKREGRAEDEGWRLRKDGTRYWARTTIAALRTDDSHAIGYAVVVRDLSERRAYENALRESENRFRTAVTNAPVPMMLHAEDGEVLAVSQTVLELTGYSHEDLRTMNDWVERAYGDRAADIHAIVEDAFAGKPLEPTELPVRIANGETRRWLFSLSAPLDIGSGRRGLVVVAVDVTNQRRAEQALQESHRQKDLFIAMLGHELRNPLAAVRTATELLKMISRGDSKYQRIQEVLERQTGHMAKLIDGLLEVSRLVSGRISLERETLVLRNVLEETIQDRMGQVESRGIEVRTDIEDDLWLRGDRVHLAQVFDNLLSNALKFTQPPGLITIIARREGEQAIVRIRDTGVGIDPSLLPYIFEPFRQAEQSLGRAAGGLGLGLAIVKGVVEVHGGTVSVASPGPNQGSEFTVCLPLSAAPADQPATSRRHGGPARVLIVEDNVDAADTLRTVLETIGNEVEVAYDGQSALNTARRFHPDIVLCDIGLPAGMSGYDVARELRASDETAFLVALTGYGRPEDIRRAHEVGFDAHLTKPIAVAQIQDLLTATRH